VRLTVIIVIRRADNGFAAAVANSKRANYKRGKTFSPIPGLPRLMRGGKHNAGETLDRPPDWDPGRGRPHGITFEMAVMRISDARI